MIDADQSTPATPWPLLPAAPRMPGDDGAVAVVVHHVAVVGDEVVAVKVAGEAVAAVGPQRIRPDVRRQVGVVVVDAGVDHGDDDIAAARGDVPGGGGVDVGEGPLLGVRGIVGRFLELLERVGLEAGDLAVGPQQRGGRRRRRPGGADEDLALHAQPFENLEVNSVGVAEQAAALRRGSDAADRRGAELDDPIDGVVARGADGGGAGGGRDAANRRARRPGMRRRPGREKIAKPIRADRRQGAGRHQAAVFEALQSEASLHTTRSAASHERAIGAYDSRVLDAIRPRRENDKRRTQGRQTAKKFVVTSWGEALPASNKTAARNPRTRQAGERLRRPI